MVNLTCPYEGCSFKTGEITSCEASIEYLKLHTSAVHPPITPAKQERAKLPQLFIDADGIVNETSLGIFKQQLASYKRLSGINHLTNADTVLQGLPQSAYNTLFSRYGDSLTEQSEIEVLNNIKSLLVCSENKLAHLLKLHRIKQERDQTVAVFSAKIRADCPPSAFSSFPPESD